jgi:hypothetical protein
MEARGSVVGAARSGRVEQPIRAAELVGALSVATDPDEQIVPAVPLASV